MICAAESAANKLLPNVAFVTNQEKNMFAKTLICSWSGCVFREWVTERKEDHAEDYKPDSFYLG
jgi:hypothetical protein